MYYVCIFIEVFHMESIKNHTDVSHHIQQKQSTVQYSSCLKTTELNRDPSADFTVV